MPFDKLFGNSSSPMERKPALRPRTAMDAVDRARVEAWAEHFADPVGGWMASFDFTFGSGVWPGKRIGARRDRRDYLVSQRKRGFDADDALVCFQKFMDRSVWHVSWIAGIEPNPDHSGLNPGHHGHALLAGAEDVHRVTLEKLWCEENGTCRVRPLRCKRAASLYATKHVVRRGQLLGWKINNSTLWRYHVAAQSSQPPLAPELAASEPRRIGPVTANFNALRHPYDDTPYAR